MSLPDSNFNAQQRALFAQLADVLIPAREGMPSASDAGVDGQWLDIVLAARPELIDALQQVLREADGRQPADMVTQWRANNAAAFGVLAELVPAAYFLNPEIRRAIGYDGQSPRAIDPHPDYLDNGLLESVIQRGPIYRPTP